MLAGRQQACYIARFHSPHSRCSALLCPCGGTQAQHVGAAQAQSQRLMLIMRLQGAKEFGADRWHRAGSGLASHRAEQCMSVEQHAAAHGCFV